MDDIIILQSDYINFNRIKSGSSEGDETDPSKDPSWTYAGKNGARFISAGKYDAPVYLDNVPCLVYRSSTNGLMLCLYCKTGVALESMNLHARFHPKIKDSTNICSHCGNRFVTAELSTHMET